MTELPRGHGPVDALRAGSRIREWRIEAFIARGAYGQVFEARRDSWAGESETRALKVFDPILSSAARTALVSEFGVLSEMAHPHLLGGEDAFDVDEGPLAGCVVFVLERADRDLATEIAERGPLGADRIRSVGCQVASGLAALHEAGHLHGDVKPENVLLVGEAWKLGDFGVSATLEGSYALASAATLDYRPPELSDETAPARTDDEPGLRLHRSADLWALGVTLWVAATAAHPFVGSDPHLRYAAVRRGERSTAAMADPVLARLLEDRCLAPDPRQRAEAGDLARTLALGMGTAPLEVGTAASPVAASPDRPPDRGATATTGRDPAEPAAGHPAPTDLAAATPNRPSSPTVPWARSRAEPSAAPPPEATPVPISTQVRNLSPGRLARASGLGAATAGAVAEVTSLAAAAVPGGLATRRATYLVAAILLITVAAALTARRWRPHIADVAAAATGAIIALAVVSVFLFGALG